MMLYLIIAVVWIACGALSYGIVFAYWQKEFKSIAKSAEVEDRKDAFLLAFGGPLALIQALNHCGTKHGLMYRSIHASRQRGD